MTIKKVLFLLLTCYLFIGFVIVLPSAGPISTEISTQINQQNPILPRATQSIRVAIYNEPNTTVPAYAPGGTPLLNNNYFAIWTMLENAGYQVTNLTEADILDYQLKTANYDVFLMVDSLPRESIINLIKDFWLGGGGILSFDSAMGYICYAGMIPPESVDDDGHNTYWQYASGPEFNISIRHPVTKNYQVDDIIDLYDKNWASFNWTALQETSVASDLVKLGEIDGSDYNVPAIALDASLKGGRVVHLPDFGQPVDPNIENLIVDAVEWLCPHPKGRVLYDFSHFPYYDVDIWDAYCGYSDSRYAPWRNALVNRSYTFDKLYPSASGNLTASTLAQYNMLIVITPEWNFTAAEVDAVTNWVLNGGGLIVFGDQDAFAVHNLNINYLLSNFDMSMSSDQYNTYGFTTSDRDIHPTTEWVSTLRMAGGRYVNYTGTAYPLWRDEGNTLIAAQEAGMGRVILAGDINFLSNYIGYNDNYQYAINLANWLTASTAGVLIYADTANIDANSYVYRGPVAQALNDLGIPFYLTGTGSYFNLSLYANNWNLVIVDNIQYNIYSYFSDILNYLKTGGKLIICTWRYNVFAGVSLWDYIGFNYAGNSFSAPPTIYLWDTGHSIFNIPVDYNANNISTPVDLAFGTECQNLTRYNNATAIAGLVPSQSTTSASIIIGAGGRAIANGMLLTVYMSDTDDSTYPDAVEIWKNEILFLLGSAAPQSDNPSNITAFKDSTIYINWTLTDDLRAGYYRVIVDNIPGPWLSWTNNTVINHLVDTSSVGIFNYTIEYNDDFGVFGTPDTVIITIISIPESNNPSDQSVEKDAVASIPWILTDAMGSGYYRVLIDNTPGPWTPWTNNTLLNFPIITTATGIFNYTIEYNNSYGVFGSPDTVIVTVTKPPIPGFLFLYVVFGIVSLVMLKKKVKIKF
ncbi:MAG: DUF4350 domain-containing protein [Promethearchaeota archaeon]